MHRIMIKPLNIINAAKYKYNKNIHTIQNTSKERYSEPYRFAGRFEGIFRKVLLVEIINIYINKNKVDEGYI